MCGFKVQHCLLDLCTTLRLISIPEKRWHRAFIAICSSRILVTLAKDALDKKKDKLFASFSRSPSYTIIDIQSNIDDGTSLCFNSDHKALIEIIKEKNPDRLRQLGGVEAVVASLQTDVENGICGDAEDVASRRNNFGSNSYPKQPPKSLFHFVLEAIKDTTILILLGCAILSLGFGIRENGWKDGWYDGGSIFVAVFIVIAVSAFSNFRQSRQFEKLSRISDDIQIEVIRSGRRTQISIFDIVVGDIVCLKIGDQIPADGLFLDGHSLQVDESSMTGESDHVEVDGARNPFLISGAKVADGYGRMLVTSVGMNTAWGEMMSSINRDSNERTPLQERLDKLTLAIGKVGLVVAFLVLVVLLVRYFTGNTVDDYGNREFNGSKTKINAVLNAVVRIIADAITIVVVAIPEGLPLAVTLTLSYSMKRMMADQAMVRKLMACETMGSATTICTDKTGTLTINQMKVTEFWLGLDAIKDYASPTISSVILDLLHQGAGLNSTGAIYKPHSGAVPEFSGSPTEKAILSWAALELNMEIDALNKTCTIIKVEAFNSEKKRSGLLLRKNGEKMIHIHWKGAAEMILAMCSSYYDRNGSWTFMGESERKNLEQIIQSMAANSLRCIAFAHKEITEEELEYREDGKIHQKPSEEGLTLLGLVGLKDPCRPGVKKAVEACKDAGVHIKMITGDNIFTARAIAIECGILDPNQVSDNGAVVEGVEFRNYTQEERMETVDRIRVMARSSPFDKLLMVQCLKQKGHVVAVTGDGTNDAPALKEANIGLSMGIQGTEVAKESSDIVILDDNFASVAMVLMWGRCVYNNIQKFIQFQLTVNVAALVINFVAAISAGKVPLTAVQLLWVNLIMDTLGALALATERPTKELMEKPPVGRTEPLITNVMWRNLMAQALYQVSILLTLQFRGESIFSVDTKVNDTLIFNTFVLCQVFNEFNARKLEKKNVFKGIHKNKLFIGIVGITIILQVVMVEFLKRFAGTERLDWREWCLCIGLAAISWPIGWIVKWIPVPEKPFLCFLKWQGCRNGQ
ncbi:putative calcium-transporting ATPase 13, plasma membrane-type isoform X2 [Macadamia integrifolia]|uniref:putative calcium-transporting ATPase 13, plasma membrane-type isoform X2 n=1 Tax=Macadamia integrifolia TaxID=60698 RepID=UPI001C500EFD|nr:putative calcium-transporting ATPase 13, plasma membrane-type isoform X2 [Macadamia integrifolia]